MNANTTTRPTFIEIKRTFSATAERIWKAWTDPKDLLKWSCPKDFTVTHAEGDLRIGGAWRSGMRSPDGEEYKMQGTYKEIKPYTRLAWTHAWEQDEKGCKTGHETLITLTLIEQGEKTLMTFHQENFDSTALRDSHEEGWSEAIDNLEDYITASSSSPLQ